MGTARGTNGQYSFDYGYGAALVMLKDSGATELEVVSSTATERIGLPPADANGLRIGLILLNKTATHHVCGIYAKGRWGGDRGYREWTFAGSGDNPCVTRYYS